MWRGGSRRPLPRTGTLGIGSLARLGGPRRARARARRCREHSRSGGSALSGPPHHPHRRRRGAAPSHARTSRPELRPASDLLARRESSSTARSRSSKLSRLLVLDPGAASASRAAASAAAIAPCTGAGLAASRGATVGLLGLLDNLGWVDGERGLLASFPGMHPPCARGLCAASCAYV